MAKKKDAPTTALSFYELPTIEQVDKVRRDAYAGGPRSLKIGDHIRGRLIPGVKGRPAMVAGRQHFIKLSTESTIVFYCPGASCFVCKDKLPEMAKSSDPLQRAKAESNNRDSWCAKAQTIVNMLIRGEESSGPQTIKISQKFITDYLKPWTAKAERDGNPFDPSPRGFDIEIEVVSDNGFPKQLGSVVRDALPLSADPVEAKNWIEGAPDLEAIMRPLSYAEIKARFEGVGNPTGWRPPEGTAGYGGYTPPGEVHQGQFVAPPEGEDDEDDEDM